MLGRALKTLSTKICPTVHVKPLRISKTPNFKRKGPQNPAVTSFTVEAFTC